MSSKESAISVENLSKHYQIYSSPKDRFKQLINPKICSLLGLPEKKYYKDFAALTNINLNLRRGDTIGILGANGAGKSTLLQVIAGTLSASSGSVGRSGRIAAILELGAGFNPEFTGRENARLNAALLGLSPSQIEENLPQIEAYAEIGEFFDQPVKIYSSGMYSRLAFAVAAHTDPEILIVDEALSVGDTRFQAKCFRTFEQFQAAGKTILFVTHSVDLVLRHCTSAILLDKGSLLCEGDPKYVVHQYLNLLFGKSGETQKSSDEKIIEEQITGDGSRVQLQAGRFESRQGYNSQEYRWGHGGAKIVDALLHPHGRLPNSNIADSESQLDVYLLVAFERAVERPIYGITLKTPDGVSVAGTNSRDWRGEGDFSTAKKGDVIQIKFGFIPRVASGDYLFSFGVAEDRDGEIIPLDRRYDSMVTTIIGTGRTSGLADLGITFECIS
jgi:lipopolysaccharide transport system ATP-binding protein